MNNQPSNSSRAAQFRRLSVLISVACVDMLGFGMIFPLLPFYALDLHISPQLIGVIVGSFSLAQLLSAPLWGRVSDRYGRKPALLIGLTASALSYVVFGFAGSFWLLLISRVIQGAGGGTTGVLHAYIADTVVPEERARSLGWLSAATSAGTMVGPVIGSMAARWGQAAPGLLAAGLCVINIIFAWGWLQESSTADSADRNKERKPVWHMAWTILRSPGRPVARLVWIYALGMLAFSSFTAIITLYLGLDFGVTERNIGYVFLYVGALSVVMRSLLLGPIVSRLGETRTLRLGAVALLLGFLALPVASNLSGFMAVLTLIPVGTALTFPATTALTSRWAERSELGTTMGTAQSFAGVSRTISPLVSTALFQQLGHAIPFLLSAGYAVIVIFLSLNIRDSVSAIPPESAALAELKAVETVSDSTS